MGENVIVTLEKRNTVQGIKGMHPNVDLPLADTTLGLHQQF